jgi:hypothetical protein
MVSSIHEKEGSKPIGFFAKTCRRSSKYCKNNNTNQSGKKFTSNSKSKYNHNVSCHYRGIKGYIVPDCKDKAQDHANGVFKSQANVTTQSSSTSTSSSSIETIQLFMTIVAKENNYTYTWYLDTCATKHLTPQRNWFFAYKLLKPSLSMFMGDTGSQEAIGMGTIFICLHTCHIIEVSNVLHVLHLTKNLMSICKAAQGASNMEFFHDH